MSCVFRKNIIYCLSCIYTHLHTQTHLRAVLVLWAVCSQWELDKKTLENSISQEKVNNGSEEHEKGPTPMIQTNTFHNSANQMKKKTCFGGCSGKVIQLEKTEKRGRWEGGFDWHWWRAWCGFDYCGFGQAVRNVPQHSLSAETLTLWRAI